MNTKYFNIKSLLPYQRNFIIVSSMRNVGKTYGTLIYLLEQAIKKDKCFLYLVRHASDKNGGAFEMSFKKVIDNEFPNMAIHFTGSECYLSEDIVIREAQPEKGKAAKIKHKKIKTLGYCAALTEYVQIKKKGYSDVYNMLLDEVFIEENSGVKYVNGWKEPDILLNIYHSVDREENRVKLILLGNNITPYNPYTLHDFFNLPVLNEGQIWKNKNIVYAVPSPTQELKEARKANSFVQGIDGTQYGKYIEENTYTENKIYFIKKRPAHTQIKFIIRYNNKWFGVWYDPLTLELYIDDKYNLTCPYKYALTLDDFTENTVLVKGRQSVHLNYLSQCYKMGRVFFDNEKIYSMLIEGVKSIL